MSAISQQKLNQTYHNEVLLICALLLGLSVIALALYTPWLGLVGDDWWFFTHASDGNLLAAQVDANPARPMVAVIWVGLWNILHLSVWAYYIVSFVAQWLSAVLVFVLLRYIFLWQAAESLVTAAFFLLYPADTARLYLSTISTRIAVLLALAGATLWLYSHTRHVRAKSLLIGASLALMLCALLAYETPLFLLALVPLGLARISWQGFRNWFKQAATCYGLLGAYFLFRIWIAYLVSQRPTHFYVSVQVTPLWLWTQFSFFVEALTGKGWLFALKEMLGLGFVTMSVALILSMAVFLPMLGHFKAKETSQANWHGLIQTILVGLGLAVAGAIPAIVSSTSLKNAVGTLDGRLIHAAALGFALSLTGLCTLVSRLLPFPTSSRTLFWSTLSALLVSIALIGNLGLQRDYAQAWQSQLSILRGLDRQAKSLRDNTAILLLDVPTGAYDIRFYFPFTQLVSRFYTNTTVQVLPWQKGFEPEYQMLAFGQTEAIAVTEITQGELIRVNYDHIVGFRVQPTGNLDSEQEIGTQYLAPTLPETLPQSLAVNWQPAYTSIHLKSPVEFIDNREPTKTSWRIWLLAQIAFAGQHQLP